MDKVKTKYTCDLLATECLNVFISELPLWTKFLKIIPILYLGPKNGLNKSVPYATESVLYETYIEFVS